MNGRHRIAGERDVFVTTWRAPSSGSLFSAARIFGEPRASGTSYPASTPRTSRNWPISPSSTVGVVEPICSQPELRRRTPIAHHLDEDRQHHQALLQPGENEQHSERVDVGWFERTQSRDVECPRFDDEWVPLGTERIAGGAGKPSASFTICGYVRGRLAIARAVWPLRLLFQSSQRTGLVVRQTVRRSVRQRRIQCVGDGPIDASWSVLRAWVAMRCSVVSDGSSYGA